MKVIFLDVDGVLNSQWSYDDGFKNDVQNEDMPHEYHVRKLKKIIDATGAVVVLSSSWRKFIAEPMFSMMLEMQGCRCRVIGSTPERISGPRGYEIQQWMDEWNQKQLSEVEWIRGRWEPIEDFVIIDDEGGMAHLRDHLVKTDAKYGLTDEEADEAIAFLNGVEE